MVYNGAHFTAEECDKIVASIDSTAWQEGGVGGYSEAGTGTVNDGAASSVCRWTRRAGIR